MLISVIMSFGMYVVYVWNACMYFIYIYVSDVYLYLSEDKRNNKSIVYTRRRVDYTIPRVLLFVSFAVCAWVVVVVGCSWTHKYTDGKFRVRFIHASNMFNTARTSHLDREDCRQSKWDDYCRVSVTYIRFGGRLM